MPIIKENSSTIARKKFRARFEFLNFDVPHILDTEFAAQDGKMLWCNQPDIQFNNDNDVDIE